jgi:hypothetical protein
MQCARCRFGPAPPAAPASYASALYHGADTAAAWRSHCEWARSHPLLGVSAYCGKCCQVTWMAAQDVDHQAALLCSVMSRRRQEAAEQGMRVLIAE